MPGHAAKVLLAPCMPDLLGRLPLAFQFCSPDPARAQGTRRKQGGMAGW